MSQIAPATNANSAPVKQHLNLADPITQLEHATIALDIQRNAYIKAVFNNNRIPQDNFSPRYTTEYFDCEVQEQSINHVDYSHAEVEDFFAEGKYGKFNDLFQRAFDKVEELAPKYGYSGKEFFRMMVNFGIFSSLGREEIEFTFSETKRTIDINVYYIDPSLDDVDIIKMNVPETVEKPKIFQNRKAVNVIYNKVSGIVAKSEMTNRYTNCIWVWNCRTNNLIFTHYGRLAYNSTLNLYFESFATNVFYSNSGNYPLYRQDIYAYTKCVNIFNYDVPESAHVPVNTDPFVFLKGNREPRNFNIADRAIIVINDGKGKKVKKSKAPEKEPKAEKSKVPEKAPKAGNPEGVGILGRCGKPNKA